jgi:hypothetical protein
LVIVLSKEFTVILGSTINASPSSKLFKAFASPQYATRFINDVVGDIFGITNARECPAEYPVEFPTRAVHTGEMGVLVCLSEVSRKKGERSVMTFHRALATLQDLAVATTRGCDLASKVQVRALMILDAKIAIAPGSKVRSSIIESPAVWV